MKAFIPWGPQQARNFIAIEGRKPDIEQNHIGIEFESHPDRGPAVMDRLDSVPLHRQQHRE